MVDIRLPGSQKWHNVTITQAKQAKKFREETEVSKLSQGKPIAGQDPDRERAKVLMLVHSPSRNGQPTIATGANLIDIENSFHQEKNNEETHRGGAAEGAGEEEDEAADESDGDSDESMARLLQGRNARNPYK